MSSEIAIKVENLSKCYQIYEHPRDRLKQFILPRLQRILGQKPKQYFREFWALKDVSFEVKKGETFGIIGSNGSGKSTLLQMICGTLNNSGGSIQTNGRVAALLELGSGFNPEFTGRENVYMNAALHGLCKEEIDARFEDIAAFADIGDFIDQPVRSYSSGMYVRLAFSVIANVDAEILLIDEALAVGDIHFSQKCIRYLQQFKEKGALLFVSHNSNAVISLCNGAVWLDKGHVKALGSAKYVSERYLAYRYQAPSQRSVPDSGNSPGMVSQDASSEIEDASPSKGRDMRMDFINRSNLRNDLQLFGFNHDAQGFGYGGATIINTQFLDTEGRTVAWVVGGEQISIVIDADMHTACSNLIIGFQFKNRLGQILFAQNTYLPHFNNPVRAEAGDKVRAAFKFQMPLLAKGEYSIDVAIADGVPPAVRQLQWLHDVIAIESHASSVITGLIGLLFEEVKLDQVR